MIRSIAIGSLNPIKIKAVQTAVTYYYPQANILSAHVPSGVSDMPLSDEEIIQGARGRATAVQQLLQTEYGIGLEGGVHQDPFGWILTGWAVIVDANGRESIGAGGRLPLPAHLIPPLLEGEELGTLIDKLTEQNNTKQKGGAVELLTSGFMNRQQAFETAVTFALAPFVAKTLYTVTP